VRVSDDVGLHRLVNSCCVISLKCVQDDLEDCGESAFDVKVRVMPECWFVLAR
jgi:hypothetical protein